MGDKKPETSQRCLILGAGEILDYQNVSSQIPADCFVICADGGYNHCQKLGIKPHLLIGDFDSITCPLPSDIPTIKLPTDKDYTDTAFAVEEAFNMGFRRCILSGVLGGRLDHTLANIQTLGHCAKIGMECYITDGITEIYPLAAQNKLASLELAPRSGAYFSLLSLVERCRGVTIKNGAYPLNNYPLSSLEARAISNEFLSEPVLITMEDGVLVVIITPKH